MQPNPRSSLFCIQWPQTCCSNEPVSSCPSFEDNLLFWIGLAAVLIIPKGKG